MNLQQLFELPDLGGRPDSDIAGGVLADSFELEIVDGEAGFDCEGIVG